MKDRSCERGVSTYAFAQVRTHAPDLCAHCVIDAWMHVDAPPGARARVLMRTRTHLCMQEGARARTYARTIRTIRTHDTHARTHAPARYARYAQRARIGCSAVMLAGAEHPLLRFTPDSLSAPLHLARSCHTLSPFCAPPLALPAPSLEVPFRTPTPTDLPTLLPVRYPTM
eukprot:6174231-Pleurochrysis_carterae.AAC.3